MGAKLATVTIYPTAKIGSLADAIITIPGETPKNETGTADTAHSVQPMGTLFEQLSWLTYDAIILELMKLTGETTDTMFLATLIWNRSPPIMMISTRAER